MLKGIFGLPLRATDSFIHSLFGLMDVPLRSPDDSGISKRAKTIAVTYCSPSRGTVAHWVVDATGLKVSVEGERKTRQQGTEKRRT